MEFWGVEVKAGEPLKVAEDSHLLHISQASLGEAKKDKANEYVVLYLNVDGRKLVLGTLSPNKLPQLSFDLVFDRNFELSHNWKHGSVYFTGYKVPNDESSEEYSDSDSEDELVPATVNLGKREAENAQVKPGSSEGKKVRIVEPKKGEEDDDSSDEEDDDSSDEEDKMANGGDQVAVSSSDEDEDIFTDSDDEDDESDDIEKKIPEKPDLKKKRVAESSVKPPVSEKKAKLVTPQKTEGKTSGGHVATPYPSKQASKVSASTSGDQKKEQTAKPFACKPCNRSFGSENALQSHNKAKHSS